MKSKLIYTFHILTVLLLAIFIPGHTIAVAASTAGAYQLYEFATSTNCPYCAHLEPVAEDFLDTKDDVVYINYQAGIKDYSSQKYSPYYDAAVAKRIEYYRLAANKIYDTISIGSDAEGHEYFYNPFYNVPSGAINGRLITEVPSNAGALQRAYDIATTETSSVAIGDMQMSIRPGTRVATLTLVVTSDTSIRELSLNVVLTKSDIDYVWGTDAKMTKLNHLARAVIRTPIESLEAGESRSYSFSIPLDSGYDMRSLSLISFVQSEDYTDITTRRVLSTAVIGSDSFARAATTTDIYLVVSTLLILGLGISLLLIRLAKSPTSSIVLVSARHVATPTPCAATTTLPDQIDMMSYLLDEERSKQESLSRELSKSLDQQVKDRRNRK